MHQHGGCRGSSGRGATGGGASDVGSRNWEIAHGHNAPGSRGEDGDGDCIEANTESELKEQPEEESIEKAFPDLRLFVNGNEWDLSDVIDINRPCRDYCYWIIKHKNGKKTRISGNVILEEI